MDMRILFESSILYGKLINFIYVDLSPISSVIGVILFSKLNRESYVSEVVNIRLIGMTCHHGCPCDYIGYHCCKMINSIPSCTVSSEKYPTSINNVHNTKALHNQGNKIRHILLPPLIRGLFYGSGDKPYGAIRQEAIIQVLMIIPLPLVNLKGTIPPAMKPKHQPVPIAGFQTMHKILKSHFIAMMLDDFCF